MEVVNTTAKVGVRSRDLLCKIHQFPRTPCIYVGRGSIQRDMAIMTEPV